MKYILMRDRCELRVKRNSIEWYSSCDSNPEEIAVYADRKTALEELKKYHCTSYVQQTFAGKARVCEYYFVAEHDDDGNDTGNYDFAELEE